MYMYRVTCCWFFSLFSVVVKGMSTYDYVIRKRERENEREAAQQVTSREEEGGEREEEEERDGESREAGEEMDYHGRCWCLRRKVRRYTTQHVARVHVGGTLPGMHY